MATHKRQAFVPPEGDYGILSGAMGELQVVPRSREVASIVEDTAPQAAEARRAARPPRHTYNVSDEVHRQAVNAADFLSGPPHRERLGRLVERAIRAAVQ